MKLTKHGEKRIKERVNTGKSKKKAERVAVLALTRGLKYSDTKGRLRDYLFSQFAYDFSANNLRVYNNHVWVFRDDILITVRPLPTRYRTNFKNYHLKGVKQ